MSINQKFVDYAETLIPELYEKDIYPQQVIEVIPDPESFQGWKTQPHLSEQIGNIPQKSLGEQDSVIFDFGDHQVGYLNIHLKPVGSPPDAPLRIKFIFGEMPCEIAESFDNYEGWLSRSWLQDEIMNIDTLPCEIQLSRRYSFRYLKVIVLATSRKYKVSISNIYVTAVTSADPSNLVPVSDQLSDELQTLDRIGTKTLQDCMHTVFEDGPKRDRRLWIGDLRLQALANYETFKNNNLVKRCLYLFAGMTFKDGRVGACIYEHPKPLVDDIYLYDYSLFFVASLYDYYYATKDWETLVDLWPIAYKQLVIAARRLNDKGVVKDDSSWWCFTDWHEKLNKQASAQAVYIFCLKKGKLLAEEMQLELEQAYINRQIEITSEGAILYLWDEKKQYFVSGVDQQISWASQIWMVLAEVFDKAQNVNLLKRLLKEPPQIKMMTPYMYHHWIEALFVNNLKDLAIEQMQIYWGGMVKDGADCFWELYDPEEKQVSPYGSNLINSYCHAWSCTPTYFIRKYLV